MTLGICRADRTLAPGADRVGRITLALMLVTDLGFLGYWLAAITQILPSAVMYPEHADPRVIAWNWSFFPLDIAASVTGLLAVRSARAGAAGSARRLSLSLALTMTAGGMAISYWALRGQFDPLWWVPNLYLLLFPLPLLIRLQRGGTAPAPR